MSASPRQKKGKRKKHEGGFQKKKGGSGQNHEWEQGTEGECPERDTPKWVKIVWKKSAKKAKIRQMDKARDPPYKRHGQKDRKRRREKTVEGEM